MRVVVGVLLTIFEWFLLYEGLWLSHQWAWNVFRFMMWGLTIMVLLATLQVSETGKKVAKKPLLGRYTGTISDFGVMVVCSAYGHFWYATMAVTQLFLELYVFGEDKPK